MILVILRIASVEHYSTIEGCQMKQSKSRVVRLKQCNVLNGCEQLENHMKPCISTEHALPAILLQKGDCRINRLSYSLLFRRPGPLWRAPGATPAAPPGPGRPSWETLKPHWKTLCFRILHRETVGRPAPGHGAATEPHGNAPKHVISQKSQEYNGLTWTRSYMYYRVT